MPIYEYTCRACGAETEVFQRLSDPPEKKCPECGKPKLEKMISAAGFRLSGGGWYETDFKKDGKRNLAGDKAEEPKKADAGDKKADGKADAKSDSSKAASTPDKAAKPEKAPKTEKPAKPAARKGD